MSASTCCHTQAPSTATFLYSAVAASVSCHGPTGLRIVGSFKGNPEGSLPTVAVGQSRPAQLMSTNLATQNKLVVMQEGQMAVRHTKEAFNPAALQLCLGGAA